MWKLARFSRFIGVFLFLIFTSTGCTIGTGALLEPQSHFDFPNSNIIPLGKVHGEASTTSIFIPNPMDADLQEEAIQNALRQKGGDILIDYTYSYKITSWVLLPIYTTTIEVDGTACKMEIGEQELEAFKKHYKIEKVGDEYKVIRRK